MKQYILENKVPVEVSIFGDFVKMMAFQESGGMIVKQEYFGNFYISTVFLGLDHNFGTGKPVLFETMIFTTEPTDFYFNGNKYQDTSSGHAFEYFQTRCCTYDQAEIMHKSNVRIVEKFYLEKRAYAIIKAGALAIVTILLIYSVT
jgi:hypothetical protein